MQSPPTNNSETQRVLDADRNKSIRFPISILSTSQSQDILARALVDSGAQINCINYDFVQRNGIPKTRLEKEIPVRNVDQSPNKAGNIKFTCTLFIRVAEAVHRVVFHVTNCGRENIILGMPWLHQINPRVNWTTRNIQIPRSSDQTPMYNHARCLRTKSHTVATITSEKPSFPGLIPNEHLLEESFLPDEAFIRFLHTEPQIQTTNRYTKVNGRIIPVTIASTTTPEPAPTLPEIYKEFESVFSEEEAQRLPPSRDYDHPINVDESFVPKVSKVYPLSPDERKVVDDFIDENLKSGKIRPSTSPQAAGFFFVNKEDGALRPTQDYRHINGHTIKDAYPLPLISEIIDKTKDAKIFTKFDIRWGYNNLRIKDGDQWKAAFITHRGLFEPTVMFFGLSTSPASFQRFMNDSFRDMIAEGWLECYMDDVLLHSENRQLDQERTRRVLQRMKDLDLHVKLKKCKFGVEEVEFLGLVLRPGELAMNPKKLDGIRDWPTPEKLKDVRSFLGFANYYRKFIANYSDIVQPLVELTRKDQPWIWSQSQEQSFQTLKSAFLTQPVLRLPDHSKPFAIATDASKYATGGVLMQTDSNGDWHPCSYISSTFSPAERNYDIYDRELLAIIRALKSWRHYLRGAAHQVQVFTDHKNLLYFKEPQKLNRRQARWLLDLAEFDLKLIHVPGKDLSVPDALSRRPDMIIDEEDNSDVTLLPHSLFVNLVDSELSSKLIQSSQGDPLVTKALQALEGEVPTQFRSRLSDWSYDAGVLFYQGRAYIPDSGDLRKEVVKSHHDHPTAGHPGYLKTRQLVSAEYWWPGLAQYVRKYTDGCAICQQNKVNTHPTVPSLNPIPSKTSLPFKQISYDLITGLPLSNGYDSLLVLVDHGLTKGVILCPTKKTVTAEGVAAIVFKKLFTRFGLFDKVISDRGPQFAAQFAKELGRILGYDIALSTAYHPQTDGETERVNQEVETYLRIFCGDNPLEWSNHIAMAEFVHNHRPHSVTGKSPFFLMHGYEPSALPSIVPKSHLPAVENRLKELNAARNEALAAHELARQTMRSRIHSKFIPFTIGEKVWLEARNLKRDVVDPKFSPKREGPFEITRVLSSLSYELRLPSTWRIHPVFHASLLSRYKENEVHGPNFPAPPPDLIGNEEEYEVERILKHRGHPRNRSFLIRWKGYTAEEDSWLHEADLGNASDTLQAYKKRLHLV